MLPNIQKKENLNESIMLLFLNAPHIQTFENFNESIILFCFNAADRRHFYSSILSLIASFFAQSFLFALIFPSPPVPLGVILNDQPYVETRAYDYIP